jgi:hypothetical protein
MSYRSTLRRALLCAALAACAPGALAAASKVEAFGGDTWLALQRDASRPTIVVFATTDCVHCPSVIAKIESHRQSLKPKPALLVVVMDASPADSALLRDAHYKHADRLMAFDGEAQRLRYGVNPKWIGVTPYVAMLARSGAAPHFVMGAPGERDWQALTAGGIR